MKLLVKILLGLMVPGAAAMVHWGPVRGYVVACEKRAAITCVLERDTATGMQRRHVALGTDARAVVRVQPVRRGPARVLLYLASASGEVFAAEFEGSDATAAAADAVAQLNRAFAATGPATARIEARPPAHLRWLLWGGVAFLGLLAWASWRELRKPDESAENR
ncbi:MAG: hypothetical protein ACOY4U_11065 [Pseudomonadota bacterium]